MGDKPLESFLKETLPLWRRQIKESEMPIRIEMKNDYAVYYITEEININSSPKIKKAILKLISKKSPKITIDFSEVAYIDSSGISMLIEIFKAMELYGGALQLANLSPRLKNIFEIKKLNKLFTIVP